MRAIEESPLSCDHSIVGGGPRGLSGVVLMTVLDSASNEIPYPTGKFGFLSSIDCLGCLRRGSSRSMS
jgi:hypothetical protein